MKMKSSPKSRTPARALRRKSPANLFQPFATLGKTHGTGLGLSICKKIIEDHGGQIWVRDEPNRGAIFCFALPLAK